MAKKIAKKKTAPKKKQEVQTGAIAVIPYSELAQPEMHKGKFNLVPTRLNDTQIKAIIAPTPRNVIKSRPGKGGGNWDFIPGWWFKKKLNFVFGFDGWSTEIDGERIDGNFITVKGRLVIHNTKDGKPMISKSDFGGAEIKFKRGTKEMLDLPNDFKAAQTDLIKRCAVQLGFGMDVYAKGESLEAGQMIVEEPEVQGTVTVVDAKPVIQKPQGVDYLAKLNNRLEQLGYTSESKKKEYVLMKGGIPIKDWKAVTQANAQMIIAVLAKKNMGERK